MGRLTRQARVTRVRLDAENSKVEVDTRADTLAVEEPLQIRVDGTDLTTTMRTPGDDWDLIHGLLHAEGVINSAEDIHEMRYCAGATGPNGENTYNTIDVSLTHPAESTFLPIRNVTTTSACGICGTTNIEQLMLRKRHPITPVRPAAEFVLGLPRQLREAQKTFRKTGGIHAAGAFSSSGELLAAKEDVGRHNAADKVIGALLRESQLPMQGCYLAMTSRASYELVQKAVLAGFSGLIAVSAATSLAVEMAREAGLFLTGFTRDSRFNLYSGQLAESDLPV